MKTMFLNARKAARAQRKIMELLDESLRDELVEPPPNTVLTKDARTRQGSQSSG